jgi:hypothetical protein
MMMKLAPASAAGMQESLVEMLKKLKVVLRHFHFDC